MKKITLLLALIMCVNMAFSNPIDTTTAKIVAANFWKQNTGQNRVPDFVCEPMAPTFTGFYVLNSTAEGGFVIVSTDNRVQPILGYSMENSFVITNIPPNMREWLMGYEQQIQFAKDENIDPSEETVLEWNTLLEGGAIAPKSTTAVNPLLTTQWDQSPYYNELCPTNYYASNEHTLTGCVATAMAQVMKYWNYPAHGSGYHSYQCSFGTQSANFAATTYDWTHMPNQLTANSSTTQINAIATLMYHCGVSVDMDYGFSSNGGSGAYTQDVADALISYFKYDNNTHFVSRANYYSDNNWISLLKTELNAGRPIVYCGHGSMGGHAFVCDGYDNSNYFHFNWGWGGAYNNVYYSINNLIPGVYNFTSNQGAVIGIKPSNNIEPELEMYSTLSVNDAWFGSNITGAIQILNTGSSFTGYMAVVIFNEEEIAVGGQVFSVNNLPYNYYSTGNININGGVPLIPGTYYAFALYSEDGNNWDMVPNGANAYPYTMFDITYSAQMETYSFFSNTTFVQGQSATVNVDVLNTGSQTFYGKVRVNLSSIEDGSPIQNIQVLNITNGLPSNYHYTNGLDFTGTITAPPGTYLMELAYQRNGESQWYYAGSSDYPNPVFVTVMAAPTLSVSPSSISFQHIGGNQVVNVTSNVNWTASSSASWLTVSPNSGTESESVIIAATANNSNSSRSATITITGSGGVPPKTITVSQSGSGIQPDQYEPNNTSATAYNLGTVNSSNANYNVNANFHVTTDNDYYKINLPSGYFYTINANILNSGNNSSYTANAHFANSQTGNAWSSNYNNSIPELTISDGGTLYFRVLPVTSSEIGTYSLHISVTRTAMIEPDIYEPNNTVNTSYLLATINEPTSSIVANASFHTTSDEDYYKIDFPADYNYSVEVVMFDCTNDPNCSVDAKIAVSDDGNNWSSFYGISIPAMTIEHGGRFYYHVVPQQTASTGTYQLYFSISRTTGIQDNELSSIMLYPNPVTDHLIINGANEIQLDGIEIYDITGRLIQTVVKDCRMINTSHLSKGTYLMRLFTSEGEVVKKFLK